METTRLPRLEGPIVALRVTRLPTMADAEIPSLATSRARIRWIALAAVVVLVIAVGTWAMTRSGGVHSAPPAATVTPGETVKAVPGPVSGDYAFWALADPEAVTAGSTSIAILVTRLGCSGGRTGTVLTPVYGLSDTEVVLRTDVGVLPATAYTCPGNDGVPITVVLPEAIGHRALVDWVCRQQSAASTSFCFDQGIRRAA